MKKLHQRNVNIVTSFLCHNQYSVPSQLIHSVLHQKHLFCSHNITPPLKYNHPLVRIKRVLEIFNLVMLPADKSKSNVIMSKEIIKQELLIHLSDVSTYKPLSTEEYTERNRFIEELINDASLFFGVTLKVPTPSIRYIYLLPKIHKELHQWRTIFHPKMRPIISNRNSNTSKLAKFLLPVLQKIERNLSTTVTSSLAVAHNIADLNKIRIESSLE